MNPNELKHLGVPESIVSVVYEVKERTGISVEFFDIDETAKSTLGKFSKADAVLDIDVESQAIKVWLAPGNLRAHTITHELLHLRRDVLESTPRWFASATASGSIESQVWSVQNELDHLFIIPEEIALHPEAQAWWDLHYEEGIARDGGRQDPIALAMHWALLRTIMSPSNPIVKKCAEQIQALPDPDWLRVINNYQCDVKAALGDTIELMKVQFDLFRVAFPDEAKHFMQGKYVTQGGRLDIVSL